MCTLQYARIQLTRVKNLHENEKEREAKDQRVVQVLLTHEFAEIKNAFESFDQNFSSLCRAHCAKFNWH